MLILAPSQWEELSRDLPENTDLLVLDKSLSGIDQVKDYLAHQSSDCIYTQISLIASSDADSVSFGSQNLDTSELSDQVESIRDSGVIAADTVLQLFTATHIDSASVSVDVLGPANNTLNLLRGQFASYLYLSRIDAAILEAYGSEKFESVRRKLGQFVTSQASPSVEWVEFDNSSVRGSYLAGEDRIFLSSSLKSSSKLERVLLEEIGHWLDDSSTDSEGDEGEVFARSMLGLDTANVRSDLSDSFQYVKVGNTYFKAEFDAIAPTLTSASVDGNAVRLNFSEALETSHHPTSATFTVESSTDGGSSWSTQAYSISNDATAYTNNGSTIELTLDSAVADETQVRVSYSESGTTSLLKDKHSTPNALATVSEFNVVNATADTTAPTLTSASVDGNAVRLNFSEALETSHHPTSATFTVESSTDGGSSWSTQAYSISNDATAYTNNGSTIELTLDSAVADETQVRVSYNGVTSTTTLR